MLKRSERIVYLILRSDVNCPGIGFIIQEILFSVVQKLTHSITNKKEVVSGFVGAIIIIESVLSLVES